MTPGLEIEPGTHWWAASALTTAPSVLPTPRVLRCNVYFLSFEGKTVPMANFLMRHASRESFQL